MKLPTGAMLSGFLSWEPNFIKSLQHHSEQEWDIAWDAEREWDAEWDGLMNPETEIQEQINLQEYQEGITNPRWATTLEQLEADAEEEIERRLERAMDSMVEVSDVRQMMEDVANKLLNLDIERLL